MRKVIMAGPTRLELATSGVTGRRSNQAELRPHQGEDGKILNSFPFFVKSNWTYLAPRARHSL